MGRGGTGGQAEGERGPSANPALGPEPSPMTFNNLTADREPEAGAAQAGLVGPPTWW